MANFRSRDNDDRDNRGRDSRGSRDSRGGSRGRSGGRPGGSRFGGGDSRGRGGFGRDSGRSERRPLEMHDVTCDKCGKACQVPFKPSGDKPVFCSDCFTKGGSGNRDRTTQSGGISSEQFNQINAKLDKIIEFLDNLVLEDDIDEEDEEEGEEENKDDDAEEDEETEGKAL